LNNTELQKYTNTARVSTHFNARLSYYCRKYNGSMSSDCQLQNSICYWTGICWIIGCENTNSNRNNWL